MISVSSRLFPEAHLLACSSSPRTADYWSHPSAGHYIIILVIYTLDEKKLESLATPRHAAN